MDVAGSAGMHARGIQLGLSVLALTTATLVAPEAARACSEPRPRAFNVHAPPANGVLLVDIACSGELACEQDPFPIDALPVVDLETGQPVAGSVVHVRSQPGYYQTVAFKPDQPFIPGRRYEIAWQPAQTLTGAPLAFEALAAVEPSAEPAMLEVELTVLSSEVIATCPFDPLGGSCGANQYSVGSRRQAELRATIDAESTTTSQLVVTFAAWVEGSEEPDPRELWPWDRTSQWAATQFDSKAEAYCYRLEVTSLIDASVAVREGCIEHGDLGELGVTDYPGIAEIRRAACDGTAPPQPPEAIDDDAGARPDASTQDDADAATGGGQRNDDVLPFPSELSESGGGSCSVGATGSGVSAFALALTALVLLGARRKWHGQSF